MPWPESTVYGAAAVLGLRHGLDWDHLAALTDLTGSRRRPRESMALATMYVVGHAAMIALLDSLAIVLAVRLPDGVDGAMERFVGVSLLALGAWIVLTAFRTGSVPAPRSRWMLLIGGARRAWRRIRTPAPVVIEHDHPHDHGALHDHDHRAVAAADPATHALVVATAHAHRHRHVLPAPDDPFMAYGGWSSFGLGLLHGIGAETPTQLLLFAAATSTVGTGSRIALLASFVAGLVTANTAVALGATYGFRTLGRDSTAYRAVAVATAAFSLVVGSALLLGWSVLPGA